MTESTVIGQIIALLGPLIGAGAGSYFGLKGALNGIKDRTQRIELVAADNHDSLKDIDHEVREIRRELEVIAGRTCPLGVRTQER